MASEPCVVQIQDSHLIWYDDPGVDKEPKGVLRISTVEQTDMIDSSNGPVLLILYSDPAVTSGPRQKVLLLGFYSAQLRQLWSDQIQGVLRLARRRIEQNMAQPNPGFIRETEWWTVLENCREKLPK